MHESLDLGASVAGQIRKYRLAKNWSIRQLAEECERLGAPQLTAPSLTNIERGQDPTARRPGRRVLVDELLVLATALDVPPLALLVSLDGTRIDVTSEISLTASELIVWFEGKAQPGQYLPTVGFMRAAAPLGNYSAISDFLHQAVTQERSADRARRSGDDEAAAEALRAKDQSVRNAAHVLNTLIDAGIQPPALARHWVDLMTSRGLLERPEYVPVIEPDDKEAIQWRTQSKGLS